MEIGASKNALETVQPITTIKEIRSNSDHNLEIAKKENMKTRTSVSLSNGITSDPNAMLKSLLKIRSPL